jgi:hypothetical protein
MSSTAPATERQLRYLRVLAARTATTFVTPDSRPQASREIERLCALARSEPQVPRESPREDERLLYATAVSDEEITGFGSSTAWRSQPVRCAAPRTQPTARNVLELARYRVSSGERVLYSTRAGERLCVFDAPVQPGGARYPVEELGGDEAPDALGALIADYLAKAKELDDVPMAASALAQMLGTGDRRV